MASALYTDIKRKEGQSVFIRPHEGLFGLREWIEQGVAFQASGAWRWSWWWFRGRGFGGSGVPSTGAVTQRCSCLRGGSRSSLGVSSLPARLATPALSLSLSDRLRASARHLLQFIRVLPVLCATL